MTDPSSVRVLYSARRDLRILRIGRVARSTRHTVPRSLSFGECQRVGRRCLVVIFEHGNSMFFVVAADAGAVRLFADSRHGHRHLPQVTHQQRSNRARTREPKERKKSVKIKINMLNIRMSVMRESHEKRCGTFGRAG